jgi:hypothetical protein
MIHDRWLRVRLTSDQDQKLERYCLAYGLSRSDLLRRIVESMPDSPESVNLFKVVIDVH